MGDMTIKGISDTMLEELRRQARSRGVEPEVYAAELLREVVASRGRDRAAVARQLLAGQQPSLEHDSVSMLREDRSR